MLEEIGIGTPVRFITFKGADMNMYYSLFGNKAYQDDLIFLMFPLDNLHFGKLVIFKLKMGDKWFDDIVNNNKTEQNAVDD